MERKIFISILDYFPNYNIINKDIKITGDGDWGLGIGDWGLGIGPNPQSPIPNPNPQSPLKNS
jgi:hypothetical protein